MGWNASSRLVWGNNSACLLLTIHGPYLMQVLAQDGPSSSSPHCYVISPLLRGP
jgi:hypothetical protein